MARKVTIAVMLFCSAVLAASALAADTNVHGRLYAHWGMDLSDSANDANEFALGRTYLTVKSKLSDFTSLRITTDLRSAEDTKGKTQYNVIVKYGYLDWKPSFTADNLKFRFGLQPTQYIDFQNKLWGRRYLSKTVSDKNKYLTSSDLGLSALLGLGSDGKTGSLVLSLFNGTSYSSLGETNKQKDVNAFARLSPLRSNENLKWSIITGQFYYGTQNKEIPDSIQASDYKRQLVSVGGLFAYRHALDLGIDLNWYTTGEGPAKADRSKTGFSFFGTFYFNEVASEQSLLHDLNIFGRVDLNDPDTDVADDGNTFVVVGIEAVPTKGFKAALNFRAVSFQDDTKTTTKELFFNTLFKL